MDMVSRILLAVVLSASLFFAACTTDNVNIGVNQNSVLATLEIKNCELQPPFSSLVTNYIVVKSTNEQIFVRQLPAFYKTRVLANGVRYKPTTNDIGLPDYTDLTRYISSENNLVLDCFSDAGSRTRYTITFLGPESDASIRSIDVVDSVTGDDSGSLYPFYKDGIAPSYKVSTTLSGSVTNNSYRVNSTSELTKLKIQKINPAAKVYLSGSISGTNVSNVEIGAGVALAEFICDFRGMKQFNSDQAQVRCVSSDGKYTNTKYIGITYLSSAKDNRLLEVSIGGNTGLYPEFYSEELEYYVATEVDADGNTQLKLKKAQAGQVLTISVFSNDMRDLPMTTPYFEVIDSSTQTEITKTIPANMGDTLKIKVTRGGDRVYSIKIGAFTSIPYGFDGGIKDLLDDITQNGENFKKVVVEGILTVKDFWGWENAKKCLFIEDGKAGLYVFLNDVVYAGLKVKPDGRFKTGSRVRMRITAGKVYYEMSEATAIEDLELVDGRPRPIAYRTGGYDRVYSRGKIWKYTETVGKGLNTRGEGEFADTAQFFVNRYKTYLYNPPLPEVEKFFGRFVSGFKTTVYGPVIWSYSLHRIALFRPEYSVRTVE